MIGKKSLIVIECRIMNNISYLKNKSNHTEKNIEKSSHLILCIRWLFLIFVGVYCFTYQIDHRVGFSLFAKYILLSVYNFAFTLYIVKHKKIQKKAYVYIIFTDMLFICYFTYELGGIKSDLYIFLFFLIAYSVLCNYISNILLFSVVCIVFYSAACIMAYKNGSGCFDVSRLFIRGMFILIAAVAFTHINGKVKKYNQLHINEFKRAMTDKLTGLANRHYFDHKLNDEVEYANNTGSILNILMFDLDNFKLFNDTYGHLMGDKLLALFSDIIKQNIRKSDIPIRYGGEEFLIIIRDLDINIARSIGDRIRRQLEKQRLFLCGEGDGRQVTVSCGIAQYPAHSNDIRQVIEYADKALYDAKGTGKNKVVVFNDIS